MRKTKDGTVIASLTEVKNKTGDIFALADEFGEVILTSYNKPRYKLLKLNVSALLEEEDSKPSAKKVTAKETAQKAAKEVHVEKPVEAKPQMADKSFTINPWNPDSDAEEEFIKSITKPLI